MSDKDLMLTIKNQLLSNLHKTRRGGCQPLINHYTAVHSVFKKLVADDDISDQTWEAAAFLHDAVEDGILKLDDKRISDRLRQILIILTPFKDETGEEHFERQLKSPSPQIAAILYANCIHNANFSEMEKMYMEDVVGVPWQVARARYFQRAGRALARYADLQYNAAVAEVA